MTPQQMSDEQLHLAYGRLQWQLRVMTGEAQALEQELLRRHNAAQQAMIDAAQPHTEESKKG